MIVIPRFIFQSQRCTAVAGSQRPREVESCEAGSERWRSRRHVGLPESIQLYLFRTHTREIAQHKEGSTKPFPPTRSQRVKALLLARGKGMTGEGFAAVLPCRQGPSKDAMKYTECGQPAFTPMLGYCGWRIAVAPLGMKPDE